MIKNYLKIAVRNLQKHKSYAFINIIGLAIGLTCCTFIVLYVLDELRYDRFHENAERIVRVVEDQMTDGRLSKMATTYGPLAPALEQDLAAVEHAVRVLPYSLLVSRDAAQKYQEDSFVFVDSTFLDVFTFPLLQGDEQTALEAPFSVVLTASMAKKYYGSASPLGQTLQARDDEGVYDFTITGVLPDPPANTHFRFDFLASFSSMRTIYGTWVEDPRNWDHPPLYTYALLTPGTTPEAVEAQMPAFALRHMGERRTATRSLHVERLTDIRLYSGRESDITPGSDISYVYVFGLIAFFILLLACINFMNLATARAVGRAKEVGMRKALGARRGQLIRQFLSESMVMVAVALVLVVVMVESLLPLFNTLSGKSLTTGILIHWSLPLVLIGTITLVGLLAGSYPAFYLSAFRPTRVLKDAVVIGRSGASFLRKGLVVFQFVISVALIICTGVVQRQLTYMSQERLGFDKEHVVLVPLRDQENQFYHESLKEAWQQLPGVQYVTASSGMPGLNGGIYDWFVRPENSPDSLTLMVLTIDPDYVETYGLEMVAGRDFSEDFPTDATEAFLLNESAAERLGWTDPVGKKLNLDVWFRRNIEKKGTVVGIVKDFQYHSLHQTIDPIIFHILPNSWYYDYVSVRLHPGDVPTTLAAMEQEWAQFNPDRPFEYRFLDEQFDMLYRAEDRLSSLFSVFAGLAIFIACLGLFGLAAFTAEQRTKEIGVRKVLGASVASVVVLLSKDLLKLIGLAFTIGAPLAYLGMTQWLADFAYRVPISWSTFLLAGLIAFGIAWLTVGYHALKAALTDPAKSLRYE